MSASYQIDYLEFPSTDVLKSRRFFEEAFDWSFVSYGPTYHAMEAAGIGAGIQGDAAEATNAPLPVVRTSDLEAAQRSV
ncbi:MAG: VOC family protein, partial [Rhizobiaceae bacterium]|nr:VOC family protein [Rhizobiaceae bacterium]